MLEKQLNHVSHKTHSKILLELEEKSWCYLPQFLSGEDSLSLLETCQTKLAEDSFSHAQIGKNLEIKLNEEIRKSKTMWIDLWNETSELECLEKKFYELIEVMNPYFFLNLKHFESQFAFYPEGGFYKKHLDELKNGKNRKITCILYLNDCYEGGELVLYNREDRNKIDNIIKPMAGSCVFLTSNQIFHEVLPTITPRFSLTTWFRDDLQGF